ncbi:flagellar motor protein MotA [Jannaschia pagri]|uniref:Flagellar motor protein MotA n=1 Tax=Jannaschia pagri TaxID=2829797 RepID=A0ABQ4NM27_9RHOB|nr:MULTISPECIES: flagellar motor stator protein MotA [unclassified Jannaschia]GIT91634.1 flagellar motor protein MotA [Jannaschia sp. AI_61]GIT95468.1 flagellar motor protein MotA [Jannaschia sp. AI_62]
MLGIAGIICVFVMVFGGYLLAGGKMGIILKSLPYEMTMIGGAAVGAFLLSNGAAEVKHTLKDVGKVFKGPKWKPDDYRDLLCLLFELIRLGRQNPVALEEHIEDPDSSDIFSNYPKLLTDREAIAMISDTLRAMSMNYDDPHQVEEVLSKRIEENQHHAGHSSHALQSVADALPALGIVAAVLGVIKTMGSIDQPPEVLGKLIGGALVGTFLGVFLAYGIVGPFAVRLKSISEQDGHFYALIQEVLVANLHNHATNICIEVGRQNTPTHMRPTYAELEEALKARKAA